MIFNKTLLGANGGVTIRQRSTWGYSSMVDVLVNKSAWCVQTKGMGKKLPNECWDDGFGAMKPAGPAYDVEYTPAPPPKQHHNATNKTFAWMPVDIEHGADGSTILVDLAASAGVAYAVRYGFEGGGDCCAGRGGSSDPCMPGSCPLMLSASGVEVPLPANPFVAQITASGKCACIPPAVCDE